MSVQLWRDYPRIRDHGYCEERVKKYFLESLESGDLHNAYWAYSILYRNPTYGELDEYPEWAKFLEDRKVCVICLGTQEVTLFTNCRHTFSWYCLGPVFVKTNPKCPLCREDILYIEAPDKRKLY